MITFLSDYGLGDEFVGVCHAVIARIAPDVRIIDITHGIGRHDVAGGARVLQRALRYAPAGVHLAVVDPGVGSGRRAIAVTAGDRHLVGPDNGLLWPAIAALGGPTAAVDIGATPVRLEPVSATFHGRDVFAPVAAHLALGAPLHELGEPIDAGSLVGLHEALPPGRIVVVDAFGNLELAGDERLLREVGDAVTVNGQPAIVGRTFADVGPGQLVLYVDSWGATALAVNGGSAAERLGVTTGAELEIERR